MEIVGKRIEEQVDLVVSIAMDRKDYEEFEEVCEEQNKSMVEVLKEFMEEYIREEKEKKNRFHRFDAMHLEEKMCVIYSGICDIIQLLEINNDTKMAGEYSDKDNRNGIEKL